MHLIFTFLQTQQVIQTAPTDPISVSTLIYAIGVALMGIGGLLVWLIKAIFPKFIDQAEKRTDVLTKAVEAFPEAIKGIKDLVTEIRSDIKSTISSEVKTAKDQIITVVQDNKIKDLADAFDRKSNQFEKFNNNQGK